LNLITCTLGCQILLGTTYQNGENIPNGHLPIGSKIYQMVIKYTNFFNYKTPKIYPKWYIWVENTPSGNPACTYVSSVPAAWLMPELQNAESPSSPNRNFPFRMARVTLVFKVKSTVESLFISRSKLPSDFNQASSYA
jgi:hypothetical protein